MVFFVKEDIIVCKIRENSRFEVSKLVVWSGAIHEKLLTSVTKIQSLFFMINDLLSVEFRSFFCSQALNLKCLLQSKCNM